MHDDSHCPTQQVPSQTDTKSNSALTRAWSLHMDDGNTSQTRIRTFAQDHHQAVAGSCSHSTYRFPKGDCLKQQLPDCIVLE